MTLSGLPTSEENTMIHEFILIPLMLHVVEQNLKKIQDSNHALKHLYVKVTEMVIYKINDDYTALRKELRQRNIKVIKVADKTDYALSYKIFSRGYDNEFALMKEGTKSEISFRLPKYINAVLGDLNSIK